MKHSTKSKLFPRIQLLYDPYVPSSMKYRITCSFIREGTFLFLQRMNVPYSFFHPSLHLVSFRSIPIRSFTLICLFDIGWRKYVRDSVFQRRLWIKHFKHKQLRKIRTVRPMAFENWLSLFTANDRKNLN